MCGPVIYRVFGILLTHGFRSDVRPSKVFFGLLAWVSTRASDMRTDGTKTQRDSHITGY